MLFNNYGFWFDCSFMVIVVVVDGLGVVFELKLLVECEIVSGKLVCLFVNSISEIYYIGYYLVFF